MSLGEIDVIHSQVELRGQGLAYLLLFSNLLAGITADEYIYR